MSLSADGNTAIVGGYGDNNFDGAAWVWTRSGGVWTQQGIKLVGSGVVGNANQGYSVALSADGNTAITGGVTDNYDFILKAAVGAVWVWTRSGGVWTQQGTKLVGSGAVGNANQGWSVSLSADGNTAIVGGPFDNSTAGGAWVWTRSGGVWTQQSTKLVGSGAGGTVVYQAWSVSVSADGNTAIIGGLNDNNFAGAAWVWTRSGGVWTQQGTKLVGSGADGGFAAQGSSVSLSADGNTAIVGGAFDNYDFGLNTAVGAAWVWTRSGGAWTQQGTKLVGSGAIGNAEQGASVSLSGDGKTAIVGGPFDNDNAGAAWVFAAPPVAGLAIPTLLGSATTPGTITSDGAKLYIGSGNNVLSMPIAGGSATTLYASATTCCVLGITQTGGNLFWIDPNGDPDATAIFRGPTGGGSKTKVYSGFATGQPIVDGSGLTTDGSRLYAVDEVSGNVVRMNLDGSAIAALGSRYTGGFSTEHLNRVTVSDGMLYISDEGCTCPGGTIAPKIVRMPAVGGGFTTLFDAGAGFAIRPHDIAVAGSTIFFTDSINNTIWKMPTSGGTPTAFIAGAPFSRVDGITALGDALYVTDSGAGRVYKISLSQAVGAIAKRRAVAPPPSVSLSLVGARNLTDQYPTPKTVPYTDKNGQSLTALAYPGQVFLVVSPLQMNLAATLELVQINGGLVIAQIPTAGLFWAQVAIGSEATFINGTKSNSAVIYVAPHVPLTTAQATTAMVDLSGASSLTPLIPGNNLIAQFDQFRLTPRNNVCGFSHGAIVDQFLEQAGQRATTYDVTQIDRNTNQVALDPELFALTAGSDVGFGILRAAEGALQQRQTLIVNVSLQSSGQPNDSRDRTVCETDHANPLCFGPDGRTYAAWKSDQFAFLVGVASGIQYMRDDLRNNTLVVVSSGNSGLNLTRELALLKEFMPKASSNMLVVGSLGSDGQPFAGHNYSTSGTDIIYAPGVDVAAPITAGCSPSGTSFAAPQIANLAAQIAQRFPHTTTAQIVAAINAAATRVNGLLTIPTVTQVANVLAPSTPAVLSFAASPATITTGQSSTLTWTTTNATSVSINGVVEPLSGSVPVSPAATTTYSLTATGPGGTATAQATITVNAVSSFTMTVARTGSGSGTVTSSPSRIACGATCSASFTSGASVTLTEIPATGSTFGGWSGGGCSGTGSCTVTMNSNITVTAIFNLSGSNYTYANWNCNNQSQCIAVLGHNVGSAGPFCSPTACDAWRQAFFFGATCTVQPMYTIYNAPPPGTCSNYPN